MGRKGKKHSRSKEAQVENGVAQLCPSARVAVPNLWKDFWIAQALYNHTKDHGVAVPNLWVLAT